MEKENFVRPERKEGWNIDGYSARFFLHEKTFSGVVKSPALHPVFIRELHPDSAADFWKIIPKRRREFCGMGKT